MSFTFRDIQIALDTKLNLLPGGIPIAWENTQYKPVEGNPWIRPTVLNGPSSTADLSNKSLNPGIYRIDCFYPVSCGIKPLLDKLDQIVLHYKSPTYLTSNDTTVIIRAVSITKKAIDNIWLMGSVSIVFNCYEDTLGQ